MLYLIFKAQFTFKKLISLSVFRNNATKIDIKDSFIYKDNEKYPKSIQIVITNHHYKLSDPTTKILSCLDTNTAEQLLLILMPL
jgi:hypothetical protein